MNEYTPDYSVYPPEVVKDHMPKNIDTLSLSGVPDSQVDTIKRVISGDFLINSKVAEILEEHTQLDAQIWIEIQNDYLGWNH